MSLYRPLWIASCFLACLSLLTAGCGADLRNVKFKDTKTLAEDRADRRQAKQDEKYGSTSGEHVTADEDPDDLIDPMAGMEEELEDPHARPPAGLGNSSSRPAPQLSGDVDRGLAGARDDPAGDDDPTEEASEGGLSAGTYTATSKGKLKLQIILLKDHHLEISLNGQKLEESNSKNGKVTDTSDIEWIVIGKELEFRHPDGTVAYYRIEDQNTFAGPVARKEGQLGEREITAASSRTTFTKGTGSVAANLDPGSPSPTSRPSARPPVNAKVGFEIGNLAPEIKGEDLDGVKFNLSDYRGKVVVLDFWGDW